MLIAVSVCDGGGPGDGIVRGRTFYYTIEPPGLERRYGMSGKIRTVVP